MIDQPLVSIITPCYNGEKYVHRFFDSILDQTYRSIELIFVNDGSTDKTEEVALSYKDRLELNGIHFVYICQENKGLAGAINTGLLKVRGKYLCWPDSDDYLEATSIEKRVRILEEYPDYAVVTSDAYIRDNDCIEVPLGVVSNKNPKRFLSYQFELLLIGESIFCCGCHMVRYDVFQNTHSNAQIFNARRGQNWQMLLPIYYKHKRYFLDEPLYNYIRYQNTMSQGDETEDKEVYRCDEHVDILLNTLKTIEMPSSDKGKYVGLVNLVYTRKKLNIAYKYGDEELFKSQYLKLKSSKQLKLKDMILYLAVHYRLVDNIFRCAKKIVSCRNMLIRPKSNVAH